MDNSTNIPAYQRKRKIAALERKTVTKKPRKTTRKRRITRKVQEMSVPTQSFIQPIFGRVEEIPEVKHKKVREMRLIGRCDGYFDKINVAIVKLITPLREGDRIVFEKDRGLFEQTVDSIQIDRKDVRIAHAGDDVGMKVALKPKVGASVYKVL